jgi:hypothetical protein
MAGTSSTIKRAYEPQLAAVIGRILSATDRYEKVGIL